ncbi:MAG: WYL domain-containing protein [Nitrospirae bacterium]|nr:WYL domain-containing protein [Nitrospirota bacterium]
MLPGDPLFTMRSEGWSEIKSWLLSFSHYAEVLETEKMRAEIRDDLTALLTRYQD